MDVEIKCVLLTDTGSSQGGSSDILRLKRRFIRDQKATQAFFMKRNIRLKKMREVQKGSDTNNKLNLYAYKFAEYKHPVVYLQSYVTV